jgi:GTP-binding protein HflX
MQTLSERVLLVGTYRGRSGRQDAADSIAELGLLAATAGGEVVADVLQERRGVDPATCVGKGKAEEIGAICRASDIDLVVFDDDLSPAQARNLEKLTEVRVLDRSQLILDIFALGARTSVAKAQVELAQLEYTLPRLTGMWEHLSRTGGGIGTRGPGETQLEVDRRRIRRRIFTLKRALTKFEQDRIVRASRRKGLAKASLVGYTNSGKSTLFNHLTGAGVATGDKLFKTLDTTTRLLHLPGKESMLLSDTVGFIRKLPHHLVVSFHATLECVIEADVVVHVVDIARPTWERQIETVRNVLEEIGAGGKQEVLVFNKVDLVSDRADLRGALRTYEGAVAASAVRGLGIDELQQRLFALAVRDKREIVLTVPEGDGKLLAYVQRYGTVLGSESRGGALRLRVRIAEAYIKPIERNIDPDAR